MTGLSCVFAGVDWDEVSEAARRMALTEGEAAGPAGPGALSPAMALELARLDAEELGHGGGHGLAGLDDLGEQGELDVEYSGPALSPTEREAAYIRVAGSGV